MANYIEGSISAEGCKFGIIVSRFNHFITERLLEGAIDALVRHGAEPKNIDVVRVPGSFEIPPVARRLCFMKRHDAIICLGAVIRGSTPHFDYIAAEVSKGVAQLALQAEIPVVFGVITTETIEQAIERAGTKVGNKGWDAAIASMELIQLYRKLQPTTS